MLMAVSGDLEAGGLSLLTWVKPSGMGKATLLKVGVLYTNYKDSRH